MAANQNPGALAGATGAEAFCSAVSAPTIANLDPVRQPDPRASDVLTALADADRALALGLYRAAHVHLLRAARLAIRWPS